MHRRGTNALRARLLKRGGVEDVRNPSLTGRRRRVRRGLSSVATISPWLQPRPVISERDDSPFEPTTVLPSSLSAASTVSYVFGNSLKENEHQWPQPLCAPIRARACRIQDGIEEEGPRKLQENYLSRIEAMYWRSTGEAAHLAATAGLESHTAVP